MECRAAQLGLTGTSQLRQKLDYDGDQAAAIETGGYIEQAQRLGIGPITGHDPSGAYCRRLYERARLRGAKATLLDMKVGPAERPRG
jgi:hypothetical protein